MAGHTFEERLTRLEEQFKALQALTQGLAAWEMGGMGAPETSAKEPEKEPTQEALGRAATSEQSDSSARI